MSNTTPGMVCAHHHLYSSLARGMPAPRKSPHSFLEILNEVWWRLDAALDLEMIRWSAKLGAVEALMAGTTCIIDHHESPNAIEGSLEVIQSACAEVGVRVITAYGITDRWQDNGSLVADGSRPARMTAAAKRGLEEVARHAKAGNTTMVGLHAAFTCSEESIEAAADLARNLGVGVHVHVAEGELDREPSRSLARHVNDDWLLVHCVHLDQELKGTMVHNPRSNLNNGVGYAMPGNWDNRTVIGTDGIGADMLDEARVAFALLRSSNLDSSPETVAGWLDNARHFFPDAENDVVTWNYDHMDSAWHLAYTTSVRATDVTMDGSSVLRNGLPQLVDLDEVRRKSAEQSERLHRKLAS